MILSLCVHGPLPDPWLSWAVCWTSCMHEDPDLAAPTLLGNDSAVYINGYQAFLFSFSLTGLILLATGRAGSALPPCLGVQIHATSMCVVKLVSLLLFWSLNDVGYNMHAIYKGWAWTCCGLSMAYACSRLWSCYWSQTAPLGWVSHTRCWRETTPYYFLVCEKMSKFQKSLASNIHVHEL